MTTAQYVEAYREEEDPYSPFREALVDAGLLLPGGDQGLYLRSEAFEAIVRGIDALVSASAAAEVEATYHFPLVMARELLETTDYVRSFPHLLGGVSAFEGDERQHHELLERVGADQPWSDLLTPTDLAMVPAACHPLYPSQQGTLPSGGRRVEVFGQCFRREPSPDPARMQVFRQHEVVYLGTAEGAPRARDRWVERGLGLLRGLGLPVEPEVANDPFFGRTGKFLAASQRFEALKIELVVPICSKEHPTAVSSANCHLDHFGTVFGIESADGEPAHTACIGFGVERIALTLLAEHGLETDSWSTALREALGL